MIFSFNWKRAVAAIAFILFGALLACGGGGGGGGSAPPPPSTGSIHVTNGSNNLPMTELYVAPANSTTWGPNQLTTSLSAGGAITLTSVSVGTWDIRAVWSNGATYTEPSEVVTAGSTCYCTLTPATTGTIRVTNASGSYPMTELYISESSSPTWGSNQLTSSLAPNSSLSFTGLAPGSWDVKGVWSNGGGYTQFSLQVTAGVITNVTMTPSTTGSVRVTNNTGYSITGVYISLASDPTWGSNRITTSIAPGSSQTFTGFAPGVYDIKVVLSNGTTLFSFGFTISAGGTINFNVT